jgi:class 3 adenylate cyclase/predicted ATPase
MQEIVDWLKELGLEQYAQSFHENGIDLSVLPDLTDQHLKDLGVLLGHRLKMLRAIGELAGAAPIKSKLTGVVTPAPQDTAERRQLTVMFIDLVGSTALSARLDPEDLRGIITVYHRCCAELVERNGGFVAKYIGDGVLAYFGYPQAHEHDAERAVRAGLALIGAAPKLNSAGVPLQVRIGIATGLVIVGDLLGVGASREQAVVGETPNLAARLQAIAEPGTVVIASSTRSMTGGLFEYRDLSTVALKGFAEEVSAWQVLRESKVESRFEALRSGQTPLVGRAEEIELLLRRWDQVKTGEGRAVLLTGDPGIGKSRITAALQAHLQSEPHTRVQYYCSPHHQDSALHPLLGQLERAAGFARDDAPEQKLAKLEALLAQSDAQPEEVGFIAELLSIPNAHRYPPPGLSPQMRKEKTLAALLAQVERLATREPVLVVYEDVHWIDPTTLELLTLSLERVQRRRVLLLVTARPEFKQPWPGYAHVTNLTLARIGKEQGAALIQQVTRGKALPSDVLQQILAQTDGVPLFIEELTKAVVESGVLTDAGDRYTVAGPLPPLAIPTSLHASLLARLDRLAPVREAAQIAAALGRQFSYELISAVASISQPQLDDALERLVSAELIFRRGTPPNAEYTFKHALVQDAAYSTLLRSRRQQLHAQITARLEKLFPEIMQTQPELLARHCSEAGLVEKAVGYYLKAGQQTIARGAMTETVAQVRKGLDLLSGVPDGGARQEQELNLQTTLGNALIAAKGSAAPELGEAYARARQLCEQLNRRQQLGPVLVGQINFRLVRGELEGAEYHAQELRHLGEALNDRYLKARGWGTSAAVCFARGKFLVTRTHFERAISLLEPTYRAYLASPDDPHVANLILLSRTLLYLGYVDQASLRREEAMAEARRSPPYALAHALCNAWHSDWAVEGKSTPTMLRSAEEVLSITGEQGFPLWFAVGTIMRGWCLGTLGQAAEGIPLLLKGISDVYATGCNLMVPFFLMMLAEVYGLEAQPEEGLDRLAEAAKLLETTQERWAEAEMHRLRGTLLRSMHDHAAAEYSYRQALAVAHGQSAKFWELRASLDLTRLWRDQGRCMEARELLTDVYAWFTEGFDTPVLKEAKALLHELH